MPHAFEASLAPIKRRPIYNPFKESAQAPAKHPVLSLLPSVFGVEIGASPTYEIMVGNGTYGLLQSNGAEGTPPRRNP